MIRYSPPLTGIMAQIGSVFNPNKKTDADTLDQKLFKEDIIQYVTKELQRRKNQRAPLEQQWTLNANFMLGNQYCEINPYRGGVEQLDPVYDWLEREAFNRIAPLIETRIANLKKISYMMTVRPRTNELDDYAKADVSTAILRHQQSKTDFDKRKNTLLAWNELCGNCFWLSWWDKDKGDIVTKSEDGSILYEGDLDYGILTPYEVYPESVFKQGIEAQNSIILEQVKSVDEIYDLYGIEVKGSTINTFDLVNRSGGGGFGYENTVVTVGHRPSTNVQRVITYFHKPTKKLPNGQMVRIVGDDNLVYYGNLPYTRIPIEQVVCREVVGQFFGRSVIQDLIPLQRAYNGCINRIHEFIKRVAISSYLTEEGSVDIEEYTENGSAPGAMLVYRQGYNPPVPLQNGHLPNEVMQERYNLLRDMEYCAGVSQLMVNGATPSGITSGVALQNLIDIDNTRLSLTGDQVRNSVKNLAVMWLEIFKRYANTKRVVRYCGLNNTAHSLVWSNEDINSYDIEFTTENELVVSSEMQKQKFFDAFRMGLFTDSSGKVPERVKQRALEYMQIGNYAEIMNVNLLHIQAAQRENVFFENGVLPKVSEFDNHEIHIEEHLRYILQMRFHCLKLNKPQYAAAMEKHMREHQIIINLRRSENERFQNTAGIANRKPTETARNTNK